MTIKRFVMRVSLTPELMEDSPERARDLAHDMLREQVGLLAGPRGGRYEAVGEPYRFRDGPDEWSGEHVFVANVDARYVRPSRAKAIEAIEGG